MTQNMVSTVTVYLTTTLMQAYCQKDSIMNVTSSQTCTSMTDHRDSMNIAPCVIRIFRWISSIATWLCRAISSTVIWLTSTTHTIRILHLSRIDLTVLWHRIRHSMILTWHSILTSIIRILQSHRISLTVTWQ